MKGIFQEKYGGRKDVGSIESDGYPVSLEKSDTEKRRNVHKRALMCGNVHKRAETCTNAQLPPYVP